MQDLSSEFGCAGLDGDGAMDGAAAVAGAAAVGMERSKLKGRNGSHPGYFW